MADLSFWSGRKAFLTGPGFMGGWQHVLCPLPGYLTLAERLCKRPSAYSDGWNFGPAGDDCRPISELADLLRQAWSDEAHVEEARVEVQPDSRVFEEKLLALDSSRATQQLAWKPKWPLEAAMTRTVAWYKAFYEGGDLWALTQAQCAEIMEDCH